MERLNTGDVPCCTWLLDLFDLFLVRNVFFRSSPITCWCECVRRPATHPHVRTGRCQPPAFLNLLISGQFNRFLSFTFLLHSPAFFALVSCYTVCSTAKAIRDPYSVTGVYIILWHIFVGFLPSAFLLKLYIFCIAFLFYRQQYISNCPVAASSRLQFPLLGTSDFSRAITFLVSLTILLQLKFKLLRSIFLLNYSVFICMCILLFYW